MMDSAFGTAIAAGLGSMAGASATIVTTFLTQRTQTIRANAEWQCPRMRHPAPNRAAVSISANIAEGNDRFTKPDRRPSKQEKLGKGISEEEAYER